MIFAQGSLTPSGAPAPTMKSLDQIEARTPISSAPFTISSSGSYYLTKNLSVTTGNAITIAADNVVLDLNGFTISSTASPAAGTGVSLTSPRRNVSVLNGFVVGGVMQSGGTYTGPGFVDGISGGGATINVRVAGVTIAGCLSNGIVLAPTNSNVVESCVVGTVGMWGIFAGTVTRSSVRECGDIAIRCLVASDCQGESIAGGNGVFATISASNCYGSGSGGATGLLAQNASNCTGSSVSGTGLSAATAINCYGNSLSGQGISGTTATNCYGFSASGQGISATVVTASQGISGGDNRGISCDIATGSYGRSDGGSYGIFASYLAVNSYGQSNTGTGLRAHIINSSYGVSSSGTAVIYDNHYNMPPNNYPSP